MEYIELGAAPADEDCVQVGTDDYFSKARVECHRYIDLLVKKFGKPPGKAYFAVKSNPHDFGSYLEVVIKYSCIDRMEVSFAYHVENNLPRTWTDETPVPMTVATFDE